jgi:hypothetical protein
MITVKNGRTVKAQYAWTDAEGIRQSEEIRIEYYLSSKVREDLKANEKAPDAERAVKVITGLPDLQGADGKPVVLSLEFFQAMAADNLDRIQIAIAADLYPNVMSATPSSAG